MEYNDIVIGSVLREFRKKGKVSMSAVATYVGVTQPTWSRYESGSYAIALKQYKKFCEFLGIRDADFWRRVRNYKMKAVVKWK